MIFWVRDQRSRPWVKVQSNQVEKCGFVDSLFRWNVPPGGAFFRFVQSCFWFLALFLRKTSKGSASGSPKVLKLRS